MGRDLGILGFVAVGLFGKNFTPMVNDQCRNTAPAFLKAGNGMRTTGLRVLRLRV